MGLKHSQQSQHCVCSNSNFSVFWSSFVCCSCYRPLEFLNHSCRGVSCALPAEHPSIVLFFSVMQHLWFVSQWASFRCRIGSLMWFDSHSYLQSLLFWKLFAFTGNEWGHFPLQDCCWLFSLIRGLVLDRACSAAFTAIALQVTN